MLGVDPRTVGACLGRGALSRWVRTALEGLLLSREKAAMAALVFTPKTGPVEVLVLWDDPTC